jgi:hypothetical protein
VLTEAEELIVSNDPFRLSNEPPSVRFDPASDVMTGGARSALVVAVRPVFTLKAIVGGPPWHAVVDGIPGQPPGTLVKSGARFDKLLVRSVSRDSVVIQGPDTAWALTFGKRP